LLGDDAGEETGVKGLIDSEVFLGGGVAIIVLF